VETAVGGTRIEQWQPNSTIANCLNATGQPIPQQPSNGELYNGMIAPFVNMTIKGALW
jgi:hypothetical protein